MRFAEPVAIRVPVGFQASVLILYHHDKPSVYALFLLALPRCRRDFRDGIRTNERVRTRAARNGILVVLCLQIAEYIAKAIFVYEPTVGLF